MTVVFISGPVAIIVRDREQRGEQAAASITARATPVSRSCRPAAADCGKRTCFMVLPDPGTPRFGCHPQSCNNNVGERFFEDELDG